MEEISKLVRPGVEKLRGLEFLRDIEQAHQSVEDLQEVLERELEYSYPGDALEVLEKRLLKFGFIASPIDLRAQLMRMFSQQIAGYYDPREERMVLIDKSAGMRTSGGMFPMELVSQWLITSAGLSLEEILLAHELTHAVQDQHFDLLSLPIETLDPEDGTSAVKALIEGDATLVMFDYMLALQGLDVTDAPELSESLHAWVKNPLVRGFSMFQPVPRYLMDNLLFPYVYGFDFVLHLKLRGGWEGVNRAYREIPVSTEQILHPEKYFDEIDLPTIITLSALPEELFEWQAIERNTLGEFNISLLLDGYLPAADAKIASSGWDGDRFVLFEHFRNSDSQKQNLLLAWYTTWDSEKESRDFFHKYAMFLEKRYGGDKTESSSIPVLPVPDIQQWSLSGGEVLLERRGQDVLLLDGVASENLEFLREHFWNSQIERH